MESQEGKKVNTLGEGASLAVEKYYQKILRHEAAVMDDRDPEELHQMRVGMRRLRSAVTGFAPVLDLPKEAEEKKIGKIARILGRLRDLDVMLESIQNRYAPMLPEKEQALLDKALLALIKQRQPALNTVRIVLESRSYKKMKLALEAWLAQPTYQPISHLPIGEVLPDLLLPQVSQLFLHPGWLIGTEFEEGELRVKALKRTQIEKELAKEGESLHDLRKLAKRVRYLMSLFTDFYGENYDVYLEDVKRIQECLGNLQDSIVLRDFVTDVFHFKIKEQLPKFTASLVETRDTAWQEWQILQTRYLQAEIRQNFRLELIHPSLQLTVDS
jgi:CHAD domain-containing protein